MPNGMRIWECRKSEGLSVIERIRIETSSYPATAGGRLLLPMITTQLLGVFIMLIQKQEEVKTSSSAVFLFAVLGGSLRIEWVNKKRR